MIEKKVSHMSKSAEMVYNKTLLMNYIKEFNQVYTPLKNIENVIMDKNIETLLMIVITEDGIAFTLNNNFMNIRHLLNVLSKYEDDLIRHLHLIELGVDEQTIFNIMAKEQKLKYDKLLKGERF